MKKWIFEMLGEVVAILLFLYVITVFQSCKTPKPVAETISNTEVKHDSTTNTTTETTTKEIIKESEYSHTIDADSAYTALLLQCDSAGNVLIAHIEQLQGERTDLELQLQKIKEGTLLEIKAIQAKFDVLVKGLRKEVERLEKENTELRATTSTDASVEKQDLIIVKEVPGWVNWVKWLAVVGAGFILYYLIRFAIWVYKKLHPTM